MLHLHDCCRSCFRANPSFSQMLASPRFLLLALNNSFSLHCFVARVHFALAPKHFPISLPTPTRAQRVLLLSCASVDQTPGCGPTCRSLCTGALDLAACPHGPDARLKLNYRLVAPGPERGLFGWPLSETRSFSQSQTGKNVTVFKEEDVFFLVFELWKRWH